MAKWGKYAQHRNQTHCYGESHFRIMWYISCHVIIWNSLLKKIGKYIHFNMNPKGNTRARYYETNKPRKDKFKGHKGKIRKQELFKSRLKSSQVIDSEITELQLRYAKVSFQPEGLQQVKAKLQSLYVFSIINTMGKCSKLGYWKV